MEVSIYRLEYNQDQGMFHYEEPAKQNKNTFGWVTICDKMEFGKLNIFTDKIVEKYPNVQSNNGKKYPTIKTIKKEFEAFLFWVGKD